MIDDEKEMAKACDMQGLSQEFSLLLSERDALHKEINDCHRRMNVMIAERDTLKSALREIELAESDYRRLFQTAPSQAHLDVGRAWDRMRKAGDKARAILAAPKEQTP